MLLTAFAVLLEVGFGDGLGRRAFDDIGQAVAAALGASACGWRARASKGRSRGSWLLFSGALGCWFAGQLVWSYYELVQRTSAPFPSLADVGYLMFPALAVAALLVRPSTAFTARGRLRVVLDGLMVAGALFNLSWATALGQVVHSGGAALDLLVSMAYPTGDLVLLAIAAIILVHARQRSGLLVLIAGLVGMSIADSAFVYLSAVGSYATGNPVDIGWVAAFLLIGTAALLDENSMTESRATAHTSSAVYLALPYVLIAFGIGVAVDQSMGRMPDPVTVLVAATELAALLIRQLLIVLDNRQLVLDVAARQTELHHRAFHDPLTGLANRELFAERVASALAVHATERRPLAVVFCDLDNFKTVNDTLGHDVGDRLLAAVSERLTSVVRATDTVARLGGDEFGILLENDNDCLALAHRLLIELSRPVAVAGRQLPVRASIGLAVIGADSPSTDAAELLKRADLAMYAAKRAGKATVVEYDPSMSAMQVDDLDLELALTADITHGRIRCALQPILRADGTVYAYEALARWTYLDRPVSPLIFLTVAERAGMLAELDLCVAAQAIALIDTLPGGAEQPLLTLNLGLSHLANQGIVATLLALLDRHGVATNRLVVEIPEDRAIDDPAIGWTLERFRTAGIRLALDDFGVGYSGLSRMGALGTEIVKLDRSFVMELEDTAQARDLLGAIVELAHRIGALVIAEGVETEGQLRLVVEAGCDAAQGFLLGRPKEGSHDVAPHWPDAVLAHRALPGRS